MSLKNMFHMHPVDNIIVHIQDKYQSDLTKKEGANWSWQKMFTDNDDDDDDDDRWT